MTALPKACRRLPATMLTAALATTGATNVVAALTIKVCAPVVPRTVLPAAVRVLAVLLRVTLPAKMARPELSMVRRSTGWPLLELLLLPAVVVLRIKLPPHLPVVS